MASIGVLLVILWIVPAAEEGFGQVAVDIAGSDIALNSHAITSDNTGVGRKRNLVLVDENQTLFLVDPFNLYRVHLRDSFVENTKLAMDGGAMESVHDPIHKGCSGDFYFEEVIGGGRRKRIVRFSLTGERLGEFSNYLGSGKWSVSPWGEIYFIEPLIQFPDDRPVHLTRGTLAGELISKMSLLNEEVGSASGFIYGLTSGPLYVNDSVVIVSVHGPRALQFSKEGKLLKKLMLKTLLIPDYVASQTAFKVKGAMSGRVNSAIPFARSAGGLIYITPINKHNRILAFNLDGEMVASYVIQTEKPIEGSYEFDVIQGENEEPVFVALINNELCRLEIAENSSSKEH